jgi:uncharacterized protein with HEPN domain
VTREWRDFLEDMLEHAEKARAFVGPMAWAEFEADEKTRFATIRALEIVGEAAHRVPAEVRNLHPGIPWPQIVGMRNVLAHDYAGTNPRIVYDTVMLFLPGLVTELRKILAGDG